MCCIFWGPLQRHFLVQYLYERANLQVVRTGRTKKQTDLDPIIYFWITSWILGHGNCWLRNLTTQDIGTCQAATGTANLYYVDDSQNIWWQRRHDTLSILALSAPQAPRSSVFASTWRLAMRRIFRCGYATILKN
jgi:hypothetical protein